jgi:hypothetical protein
LEGLGLEEEDEEDEAAGGEGFTWGWEEDGVSGTRVEVVESAMLANDRRGSAVLVCEGRSVEVVDSAMLALEWVGLAAFCMVGVFEDDCGGEISRHLYLSRPAFSYVSDSLVRRVG